MEISMCSKHWSICEGQHVSIGDCAIRAGPLIHTGPSDAGLPGRILTGKTKMTIANTGSGPAKTLVQLGEQTSDTTWLVSAWDAGQSSIMQWSPDNVRVADDGAVELVLGKSPDGSGRPYQGGETQSSASAETGKWSWVAQAPQMEDGAVFGMFLYQENWETDPWLEFDFEFVGADTTQVELNIHMHDANGKHIVLKDGPTIIDLGFDAADAAHLYEVELTGTSAIFSINNEVVATFDASDMPDNTWYSGKVRSFTDLWAATPDMVDWTGPWNYSGEPLVARIEGVGLPGNPLDTAAGQTPDPVVTPDPVDEPGAPEDTPDIAPKIAKPLVQLGEETNDTTWLVSAWNAGQSSITQWSPDNVRVAADGAVELVLGRAPDGSGRPYQGGETQSTATADSGTWSWVAQAPDMQDGAVFGMFLFQENWDTDPRLGFGFEFLGSDTSKIALNVQMEDQNGNPVGLKDGPLIVDLGFDAAQGAHLYEVELTGTAAIFTIDKQVVATIDASDMPDDIWYTGQLRSFTDIWAATPDMADQTGVWDFAGDPLVARIEGVGLPGNPLDTTGWAAPEPDVDTTPEPVLPGTEPTPDDNPTDPAPEVVETPGQACTDVFVWNCFTQKLNEFGNGANFTGDLQYDIDGLFASASTFFAGRNVDVSMDISFSGNEKTGDFSFDFALSVQSISSLQESDFAI